GIRDFHVTGVQTCALPIFTGFLKLTKFRLGSLVVFSAVITYITVASSVSWIQVLALSLGGLLVTSAANGFNQIIEKDLDKLMDKIGRASCRERVWDLGVCR